MYDEPLGVATMAMPQPNRHVLTPKLARSPARMMTVVGTVLAPQNGNRTMPHDQSGTITSPLEKNGPAREAPIEPSTSALPFEAVGEPVQALALEPANWFAPTTD